jgi:hypothetical protein
MTDTKLLELLKKIEDKTAKGELKWEATALEDQFQTVLSNFILRVRREQDREGADVESFSLVNKDGLVLETIYPYLLRKAAQDASENMMLPDNLLRSTFRNAKRQALGVEKAVDAILSDLESDKPF